MRILFIILIGLFSTCILAQESHQYPEKDIITRDLIMSNKKNRSTITVEVVNGRVFTGGDICLGTEEEIFGRDKGGVLVLSGPYLWTNSEIPYEIESGHIYQSQIEAAIEEYNTKTNICLYPRAGETDYVRFIQGSGCWSYVSSIGGMQEISIGIGCYLKGTIMHEISHAAGMWHEQSRTDRDNYVTINTANITSGREFNFDIYSYGFDVGSYDYSSVMHYSKYAFSSNGFPTISINMPPGLPSTTIGQRDSLSSTDIFTLNTLYPQSGCPTTDFDLTEATYGFPQITSRTFQDCGDFSTEIPVKAGDSVIFKAASSITLSPGFSVSAGSTFSASIAACPSADEGTDRQGEVDSLPRITLNEKQSFQGFQQWKVKIYPNPFSSTFNFTITSSEYFLQGWKLLDLQGKVIMSHQKLNSDNIQEIELGAELNNGLYFLQFETKDSKGNAHFHTERVIKK